MKIRNDIRMYILMRIDLSSMTPGRACAQASHAANECVKRINELGHDDDISNLVHWEEETGDFGTTIVLAATIDQIYSVVSAFEKDEENEDQIIYNVTHDPEYSVRDGQTVHLIPLDTCMWIFGPAENIKPYVEHLNLY